VRLVLARLGNVLRGVLTGLVSWSRYFRHALAQVFSWVRRLFTGCLTFAVVLVSVSAALYTLVFRSKPVPFPEIQEVLSELETMAVLAFGVLLIMGFVFLLFLSFFHRGRRHIDSFLADLNSPDRKLTVREVFPFGLFVIVLVGAWLLCWLGYRVFMLSGVHLWEPLALALGLTVWVMAFRCFVRRLQR